MLIQMSLFETVVLFLERWFETIFEFNLFKILLNIYTHFNEKNM